MRRHRSLLLRMRPLQLSYLLVSVMVGRIRQSSMAELGIPCGAGISQSAPWLIAMDETLAICRAGQDMAKWAEHGNDGAS